MNDPIIDPPAIVQPAEPVFADNLIALGARLMTVGRRTAEGAIECGKILIEMQAECLRRNNGKPGLFLKTLATFKVNRMTANRLIRKAKNAACNKLLHPLDAIYDDGHDPEDATGKKACHDCRVRGKAYSSECRRCKALNRPVKPPKEDKPIVDEDGIPIPEHLQTAWSEAEQIREWGRQLMGFAKALEGLAERPGCMGIPIDHFRGKLKAIGTSVYSYRLGFVCDGCAGQGCQKCYGGLRPVAQVRGERAAAKAKEWKGKQSKSQEPIPE